MATKVGDRLVTVLRDLTKDDMEFSDRFRLGTPMVVIRDENGVTDIVAKADVREDATL